MTRHAVKVAINDPLRPRLELSISGEVRAFARVEPRYVTLAGKAGTAVRATVTITPVHAFKARAVRAQDGRNIRVSMQERLVDGRKTYAVTIENVLAAPGRYTDMAIVETDRSIKPEIRIGVRGEIN